MNSFRSTPEENPAGVHPGLFFLVTEQRLAKPRRRRKRPAPAMKFEHFALNVPDARAHAEWYVTHAGFRVLRQGAEPPWTTFLADGTGRVVVELYSNPKAVCHDFARQHPLLFHFALVSTDVAADRAHFEKAGATLFVEETLPDGTKLTMLRDPWGVALQLCQRTTPFAS